MKSSKIRRTSIRLLLVFMCWYFQGDLYAQNSEIPEKWIGAFASARSFDKLFELDAEIPLSDSIPIGNRYWLDVSSHRNLLITDEFRGVLLYESNGELLRELSPEEVNPGLRWRPSMARFSDNDYIIVDIGVEGLFLFDPSGVCLKKVEIPKLRPQSFYADEHINIYGYNFYHNEFYLSKADIASQEMINFGSIPENFREMIRRVRSQANIVADSSGNIYVVHVSGPEIYKYSGTGELLEIFSRRPEFYRELKEDLPDMNIEPTVFAQKMGNVFRSFTHTRGIYLFSPEILLILYFDLEKSGFFGMDFCTVNGQYLLAHDIMTKPQESLAFAAKGGYVYNTYQPEMREDGHVPNPVVRRYKIRVGE